MKSHLTLVSTKDMSREAWLAFRWNGIGASECSIVMGLNKYMSSLELFYIKIGEAPANNVQNIAAFLGKNQEEFIEDMWEHWGGDQESMIANYESGNRVRKARRVNAYVINPKYPWLFVSLDFEIVKHEEKGNGTLETKTIGGYEADKWEAGIPVGYVIQVMQQMVVCEYNYGEVAILKDNRDFSVLPFEFNQSIADGIIQKTKEFWDRVVKAREIMTRKLNAKLNFNYQEVEQCNAEIQSLEPDPDGSEAYNNFLKEKYRIALPGERKGSIIELDAAQKHKAIKDQIEALNEEKQLHENILKNSIKDGCDKLDFGTSGYVSWKANKTGSRVFLNKTK